MWKSLFSNKHIRRHVNAFSDVSWQADGTHFTKTWDSYQDKNGMKYHFFHFMLQAPLLHEFLTCLRSPQWNILYHVACQRCQHSCFWGCASAWELKAWCRDEGGSGRYWHPSWRVRTSSLALVYGLPTHFAFWVQGSRYRNLNPPMYGKSPCNLTLVHSLLFVLK